MGGTHVNCEMLGIVYKGNAILITCYTIMNSCKEKKAKEKKEC